MMSNRHIPPPRSLRWLANQTSRVLIEALGKQLHEIKPLGLYDCQIWRERELVTKLTNRPREFLSVIRLVGAGKYELKRLDVAARVLRKLGVISEAELDEILIAIVEVS